MTLLNPEAKQPEPQKQDVVDTQVAKQNIDPNVPEKKIENPDQKVESAQSEDSQDPDWRAFREARKRDREERQQAERRAAEKEREVEALKAAMDAAFSRGAPNAQAYQQYYGMNQYDAQEESEEQKIERKVNELLTKKEEQYKKQRFEEEQREYPRRLVKDYPDFNSVCSQENLDYLDFHYPEISRPLQRIQEGYDKWHDTYHAVKKLIPNHAAVKKDALKADMNNNKPKSMSSTVASPQGGRGVESMKDLESRRAENWARMQRTMKGV